MGVATNQQVQANPPFVFLFSLLSQFGQIPYLNPAEKARLQNLLTPMLEKLNVVSLLNIKAGNVAPKPERCHKDATGYCIQSNC
jgi:hypothetical protein